MATFQAQLARKLANALAATQLPPAGEITQATDSRFGDYQTNAALVLAKQRGENPRALAQKIADKFDPADLCAPPQIAGAGFINFTLRREALAQKTAELLRDERLGVARAEPTKRIVIDFGSPNVAKPMHVGHIRSTVLGDALARIATFLGHDVIRDNHIGDWGTQFGMVIYGWKNLLDRAALARDPIAELVRIYKTTNELGVADPAIRAQCKEELVSLQSGDPENFAIWQECVALSLGEFKRAYDVLDIHYDIQRGESFYNDCLPAVVERLQKSGLAEISEGAVCVFFRDIPELADKPCLIRKSDGGYNYATTDIATVDYRLDELKRDTVWIVTGAPQKLHFQQIFEIARREGRHADFRHITHGSILGDDRKLMKTRSGENVALKDVLDEAILRARKNHRGEKSRNGCGGKGKDRAHHRNRRGQIRGSLAIPDDGLHLLVGPHALIARQHRALSAKRLRAHPIHLPQSRRRIRRAAENRSHRRGRERFGEAPLPIRRSASDRPE